MLTRTLQVPRQSEKRSGLAAALFLLSFIFFKDNRCVMATKA